MNILQDGGATVVYNFEKNIREAGIAASSPASPFSDSKPEYYADVHYYTDKVVNAFNTQQTPSNPYGLFDRAGNPMTTVPAVDNKWLALENGLRGAVLQAFGNASPVVEACPYGQLFSTGSKTKVPAPFAVSTDLQEFKEYSAVGGLHAATLIVNLLRNVPRIIEHYELGSSPEELSRRSVGAVILASVMPQQWAKPFVFTLGLSSSEDPSYPVLDRDRFLEESTLDDKIAPQVSANGVTRLKWAKPFEEFVLLSDVAVESRTSVIDHGETKPRTTTYQKGSKLGDIVIDEPTIGCPGKALIGPLYDRAIDAIVGNNHWS